MSYNSKHAYKCNNYKKADLLDRFYFIEYALIGIDKNIVFHMHRFNMPHAPRLPSITEP